MKLIEQTFNRECLLYFWLVKRNALFIILYNLKDIIYGHVRKFVKLSIIHSMLTEINILYPFLLALALYIMNYSTRA